MSWIALAAVPADRDVMNVSASARMVTGDMAVVSVVTMVGAMNVTVINPVTMVYGRPGKNRRRIKGSRRDENGDCGNEHREAPYQTRSFVECEWLHSVVQAERFHNVRRRIRFPLSWHERTPSLNPWKDRRRVVEAALY